MPTPPQDSISRARARSMPRYRESRGHVPLPPEEDLSLSDSPHYSLSPHTQRLETMREALRARGTPTREARTRLRILEDLVDHLQRLTRVQGLTPLELGDFANTDPAEVALLAPTECERRRQKFQEFRLAWEDYVKVLRKAAKHGFRDDPLVQEWIDTRRATGDVAKQLRRFHLGLERGVKPPLRTGELEILAEVERLQARRMSFSAIHRQLVARRLIPETSRRAFRDWLARRGYP